MEVAHNIFNILNSTNSNPNLATVLNNLGISHHNLNEEKLSAECFAKSYDFCLNALGDKHPDVATVLNNQSALLSCFYKDEEAWPLYLKAFRIYEDSLGPNHPHVARCLNNLGILEHDRGNLVEARRIYDKAYQIYRYTLGDSHCDTAQIQNNLALIDIQEGKIKNGSDLLFKVLNARINSLGSDHPQVANSYIHLSRSLSLGGDYLQSYDYFLKGSKLIKKWVNDEQCISSLIDEAFAISNKGNLNHKYDLFDTGDEFLGSAMIGLHEAELGKYLDKYVSSIANEKINIQLNENSRSKSGSFLRMQLEVLDIGFANQISAGLKG
jgi:tetratricopeptide (TPR) repeat protein